MKAIGMKCGSCLIRRWKCTVWKLACSWTHCCLACGHIDTWSGGLNHQPSSL